MNERSYTGGASAVPPKEDPETLVLRGAPRPVVRFRRGLIIGITAAVGASLVTVAWLALEPPGIPPAAEEVGGGDPLRATPPDALAGAPASYGDVPRLGPPLPGDLGRPILEHQRSFDDPAAPAGPAAGGESLGDAGDGQAAAAETDRQRLAAARDAARASGVIVQLQRGSDAAARARGPDSDGGEAAAAPAPASADAGEAPPRGFGTPEAGDVNAHALRAAPSPWTLHAGTIIPASLITGLNSDLPGTVFAQVTENVRDSATGRTVLLPQGSRLIGSYDSVVAFGQRRAMLVWQRIVLPDGSSVRLDNMPATDRSGYAGVEDRVDYHTWRLLKGIALSTLLGLGSELSLGGGSDLVRALRDSTQQNAARAGDQITSRSLDVQPTVTVRPGWPLRAIVHKDLVLRPWRG